MKSCTISGGWIHPGSQSWNSGMVLAVTEWGSLAKPGWMLAWAPSFCTQRDKSSPCAVIKLWNVDTACGMSMRLAQSGSLTGGVVHGLAKEVVGQGPRAWPHCQVSWNCLGNRPWRKGCYRVYLEIFLLSLVSTKLRKNTGHLLVPESSTNTPLDLHHLLIFSASLQVRQKQ